MKVIKLHRNTDPKNQPSGSSRLIINYNINYEFGSNTVEDGFDFVAEYEDVIAGQTEEAATKVVIGHILLPDNSICLFSNMQLPSEAEVGVPDNSVYESGLTEIAILNNSVYKPILRVKIGGDENFPIEGTAKTNNLGETLIYWTDFKNPQRWLNLTNPIKQLELLNDLVSAEVDKLLYFPSFNNEKINLSQVTVGGGDLPSGVYIPIYKYADINFNDTNNVYNSSVISIGDGVVQGRHYDGAPVNTITNKSITVSIDTPDIRYKYIHLYLAYKAETVYTVYDCGYTAFNPGITFYKTVNTLTNLSTVPLESILVQRPNYSTAKTVTQLDSVMYWANLKTRASFDFQPYINNIIIEPVQNPMEVADGNASDFRNEVTIYNDKGFLYNEVYAFYASFTIEDDFGVYDTQAYHIPGRRPVSYSIAAPGTPGSAVTGGLKLSLLTPGDYINVNETDLLTEFNTFNNGNGFIVLPWIPADDYVWQGGGTSDVSPAGEMYKVNNNAKMYHAFPTGNNNFAESKMGFWQNENEYYTSEDKWCKKSANGTETASLRGLNVRHHRFPHASQQETTTNPTRINFHSTVTTGITASQYEQINNLGAKLTNIVIPTEFKGKIKKINVFYAKRTNTNKTILGQSIALHDGTLLDNTGAAVINGGADSSTFVTHVGGNIEIVNMASSLPWSVKFQKNKKFIRSSPFDVVSKDIYSDVSYINVLYKITKRYSSETVVGLDFPHPTVKAKSTSVGLSWKLNSAAPLDLLRPGFNLYNRQVIKSNYLNTVPDYPTTQYDTGALKQVPTVAPNQTIYGYSKDLYHYRADKSVTMELQNELDSYGTDVVAQYDETYSTSGMELSNTSWFPKTDVYLINLCSFKTDLYTNFSTQELAFAGSSEIVSGDSDDIYQGDTFSNWYGYFSSSDVSGMVNLGLAYEYKWDVFELKFLHYFICQSISNINFRNRGTSNYNTYFPYNDSRTIFLNPLTPNGEANYYEYNSAYSSVTDLHQPQIASMFPIENPNEFPTRVIRTGKDNTESVYDNYRSVLTNDYIDLPKDKGAIWSIKGIYNKLSILFENTIRETMGRERILTENSESYVGAGDIFAVAPKDVQTVDGGYGGTVSQWAINTTPYGMFYVDINRGKVFLASPSKGGTELDEISKEDMYYFFRDECKFNFYSSVKQSMEDVTPLWLYGATYSIGNIVRYENAYYQALDVDGGFVSPTDPLKYWKFLFNSENIPIDGLDSIFYGFKSTYDSTYKRIILSKTDLVPTITFINAFVGFTNLINVYVFPYTQNFTNNKIYLRDGKFQLFTSVNPAILGNDTWTILSLNNVNYFDKDQWTISYYPEYKAWGSFYTYYPETLFNSNDTVYSSKGYKLYEHNKTILPIFHGTTSNTSIIEASFAGDPDQEKIFKSVQFKTKAIKSENNVESPEYLTTFDNYQAYNSYQASTKTTLTNLVTARNLEGYWSVNNFRDTFTNGKAMFANYWNLLFINTDITKKWQEFKRFVDNWFAIRFEYDNNKIEVIGINIEEPHTIIQNQTELTTGLGDYNIKMVVTPTIPLYVKDWVIVEYDGGSTVLGQIYRVVGTTYYIKFRNKVIAATAKTIIGILRTKNIKLSLLEINSSYIKSNR